MTHILLQLLLVVILSEATKLPEVLNTGCVRKEYRMLSLQERDKFHEAINDMKKAGTYDDLVRLHRDLEPSGHGGPGFPGWHRVYLLRFESALQEINPEVCLPFWDSRIDRIDTALKTSLWTDEYLGNVGGVVNTGPFAGWKDLNGDPLRRTDDLEGTSSGFLNKGFTHDVFDGYLENAERGNDLIRVLNRIEEDHGTVHIFVGGWSGGQMADGRISPSDPVFLLHHAFVDYIWEKFREILRENGRDPERYPSITDRESWIGYLIQETHNSSASLWLGHNLTQADAYLDEMRPYTYVDPPSCPIRKKLYHHGINLGNMLKPECTMPNTYCAEHEGYCFSEIKEDAEQTTTQSLASDEDAVKTNENDGTDSEKNVTPNEVHQTTPVPAAAAADVFEWLQLKEMLRSLSEE